MSFPCGVDMLVVMSGFLQVLRHPPTVHRQSNSGQMETLELPVDSECLFVCTAVRWLPVLCVLYLTSRPMSAGIGSSSPVTLEGQVV